MIYIFDVEGTLSKSKWRSHLIPDYDAYHAEFPKDKPNQHICMLLDYVSEHFETYILTGMMEKHRQKLNLWLEEKYLFLPDEKIIMRQDDNLQSSPDYKLSELNKISRITKTKKQDFLIFDDRKDVVDKLMANGYSCVLCFNS